MVEFWVRCEHGHMTAHCDEHPGSQSHFGVATHKGGCFGRRLATPEEILAAAANLDGADEFTLVETYEVEDPDGTLTTLEPGRYLVIPLPDKETP